MTKKNPEYTYKKIGEEIYETAASIFPICRSITGDGVRQTLHILQKIAPEMKIHEVPSGTKAFDWVVPKEWKIKEAFIEDMKGRRIIDFKTCNLNMEAIQYMTSGIILCE